MIPVVTMNADGELSYQIFNDNLAPVEQINRKLLAALYYAQTKLTNEHEAFSRKQGADGYTDAQIAAINTAASTLMDAVKTAVDAFETALDA